jgi:uncharacterized protein involved in type VI secretion and phage assembly
VPEISDQVYVDWEGGNPDRPFVTGSVFHGKHGSGGGTGNNSKSLTSKSGHTIRLNDGGGITVRDKSKLNHIHIDGNNKITVTAAVDVTLTNGKSTISMIDGKISISASESIDIQAPAITIGSFGGESPTKMDIQAQVINKEAETSINLKSPNTVVEGKDAVLLKSDTKANVEGGPAVNIIATKAKMN